MRRANGVVLWIAIACAVTLSAPIVAMAASSADVLQQAKARLAALDGLTLQMRGEQTMGTASYRVEGFLVFAAPNRFVAKTERTDGAKPAWERLVSDGETLYRVAHDSARATARAAVETGFDPTMVGLSRLPSPFLALLVDSEIQPADPDAPLFYPLSEARSERLGGQHMEVAQILLDSPDGMIYADLYVGVDDRLVHRVTMEGELMVERPVADGIRIAEVAMSARYDFDYANLGEVAPISTFSIDGADAAERIAYKELPLQEGSRARETDTLAGPITHTQRPAPPDSDPAGQQQVHSTYGLYVAFYFDGITNTMSTDTLTLFPDGTAYAGAAPGWDTLRFDRGAVTRDDGEIGAAQLRSNALTIRWPDGDFDQGVFYRKPGGQSSISFSPPRYGYYHAYIKAMPFPRGYRWSKRLSRAFGGAAGANVVAASGASVTFHRDGTFQTESFSSALALAGIATQRATTRDATHGRYEFDGYRVRLVADNGMAGVFRCYGLEYDDDEDGFDSIWIQGFGSVH